jgi:hypothetical protein
MVEMKEISETLTWIIAQEKFDAKIYLIKYNRYIETFWIIISHWKQNKMIKLFQ